MAKDMKTRSGFVSNSSSSSYIISVDDNPHMMVLNDPQVLTLKELVDRFGDRLFGPFQRWEFFSQDQLLIEVDDDEFCNRFLNDTITSFSHNDPYAVDVHMPHDAANAYEAWKSLCNENSSSEFKDIIASVTSSLHDKLDDTSHVLVSSAADAVHQACYSSLSKHIKDMRFCYQEVDDEYHGFFLDEADDPFTLSVDPDNPTPNKYSRSAADVMQSRRDKTFFEALDHPNCGCLTEARIRFLESIRGQLTFKRIFDNH